MSVEKAAFIKPIHKATLLAFMAAVAFGLFFQLSKLAVISSISPFAEDPVDAIGSIAVQVAVAVAILSLARAVQLGKGEDTVADAIKARLAVRGGLVVVAASLITAGADVLASLSHPIAAFSSWAVVLYSGLAGVGLLGLLAGIALLQAARHLPPTPGQRVTGATIGKAESIGEAINDLWSMVALMLQALHQRARWPGNLLQRLEALGAATLRGLDHSWVSPRRHPWRFYLAAGFTVGLANVLEEGLPLDPVIALFILSLFLSVEITATLLGVLLLGRLLGIRAYAY
ncbi:MAG: hypothetical protein EXR62_15685 [Chloroflexi bacterium]|nr:hypothetical protein [Chloroflexota bacterium]